MNAKISVFIICDEAITYLLFHNLCDCTCKSMFEDPDQQLWDVKSPELIPASI